MVHQVRSAHWRQRRRLLSATALVVPFLIIGALSLLPATVVTRLPLEPAVSHTAVPVLVPLQPRRLPIEQPEA